MSVPVRGARSGVRQEQLRKIAERLVDALRAERKKTAALQDKVATHEARIQELERTSP